MSGFTAAARGKCDEAETSITTYIRAQLQSVVDEDYKATLFEMFPSGHNRMIELGGNIYFLAKIFATDGKSFQYAAASMTGMSQEAYAKMMLSGPSLTFSPSLSMAPALAMAGAHSVPRMCSSPSAYVSGLAGGSTRQRTPRWRSAAA